MTVRRLTAPYCRRLDRLICRCIFVACASSRHETRHLHARIPLRTEWSSKLRSLLFAQIGRVQFRQDSPTISLTHAVCCCRRVELAGAEGVSAGAVRRSPAMSVPSRAAVWCAGRHVGRLCGSDVSASLPACVVRLTRSTRIAHSRRVFFWPTVCRSSWTGLG